MSATYTTPLEELDRLSRELREARRRIHELERKLAAIQELTYG